MASANTSVVLSPQRSSMQTMSIERRQRLWGWVFLSPWIIGFVVFTAAPIIASLMFTFTDFNLGTSEIHFIGLENLTNFLPILWL